MPFVVPLPPPALSFVFFDLTNLTHFVASICRMERDEEAIDSGQVV
jgi:hypothetical protein